MITKFDIKDKVFILYENKAQEYEVIKIIIHFKEAEGKLPKLKEDYMLRNPVTNHATLRPDFLVFKTKEDLLNSL